MRNVYSGNSSVAWEIEMSKWVRVSKPEPCPVCGKPDYCTRTTDGTAIRCMRVESAKPVEDRNGGIGWLHSLENPLPPLPAPKEVKKKADWTEECKAMFSHERAHAKRCAVAELLSVSVESLEALRVGIGWDEWNGKEFSSWPSRDAEGRCVGYVRRYADGTKKTNIGGTTGVFFSSRWCQHPGPVFVVEGGSDVASCETNNLNAIGRASNTCGGNVIKELIRKHCPYKKIVVIGERDEQPSKRGTLLVPSCTAECTGCAHCWPGLFGAKKVAKELNASWVMVPSGYKDMRELLSAGSVWLDGLF
jgi:hypothetical protein